MKSKLFAFFLTAASAAFGAPGLLVSTSLPHVNYVRDEPVVLGVVIENTSVFAYIIDDYPPYDNNKIEVYARDSRNRILLPKTDAPPVVELTLKPGEKKNLRINASDLFDFKDEGNYRITVVAVRDDEAASSHVISFTLVPGIKIKTARRATSAGGELEYQLLYWPRNGQENLFFRIVEPRTERVAGFADLGPVVRVEEPKIEFEGDAIIVTHQSERHRFMRTKLVAGEDGLRKVDAEASLSPGAKLEARANADALQRIAELQANPPKEDGGKPFVRPPKTPPGQPPAETRRK